MPKPRHRPCLQDGLKLDLSLLIRNGTIRRADEVVARNGRGIIAANLTGQRDGMISDLRQ